MCMVFIKILNNVRGKIHNIPSCSMHIIELVKSFIKTVMASQKIPDVSHLTCWFAAFHLNSSQWKLEPTLHLLQCEPTQVYTNKILLCDRCGDRRKTYLIHTLHLLVLYPFVQITADFTVGMINMWRKQTFSIYAKLQASKSWGHTDTCQLRK